MPIHDVGYREWKGKKTPMFIRWWIITKTGVRLAMKSNWVKRSLFAAWLPVMYWGVIFILVEMALLQDMTIPTAMEKAQELRAELVQTSPEEFDSKIEIREKLREIERNLARDVEQGKAAAGQLMLKDTLTNGLSAIPQAQKVAEAIQSEDKFAIRREVWRWLLMTYFRYPQAFMIVFLIGAVAPTLISRDVRSRAFLLYFSKPIGRRDYIFGKMMIPAAFMIAVTTLPAMVLFMLAILVSPDLSVLYSTWDIPLRIFMATLVLVIPTCSLALMLSSLTQESRFANFSWFAVWLLGHGAYIAVRITTAIQMDSNPFSLEVSQSTVVQSWSALSLYNCLGDAQALIFGFTSFSQIWPAIMMLTLITIVSQIVLFRRVSSSTRA